MVLLFWTAYVNYVLPDLLTALKSQLIINFKSLQLNVMFWLENTSTMEIALTLQLQASIWTNKQAGTYLVIANVKHVLETARNVQNAELDLTSSMELAYPK